MGLCPILHKSTETTVGDAPAVKDTRNPGNATLEMMSRTAVLHVLGKDFPAIEKVLQLKRRTVDTAKKRWPTHWDMAVNYAEQQLLRTVRASIGNAEKILPDVNGHLGAAEAAERLAAAAGGALLPKPDKPTLSTFFQSFVRPNCLYDVGPGTLDGYQRSIRFWRFITADPPLEEITVPTLTLFRNALSKRRGQGRCTRIAPATVRGHLRDVQFVLDKAGPPGRRNRDAQGLIGSPPWIRPPRVQMKLPRTIAPQVLKLVYDASALNGRSMRAGHQTARLVEGEPDRGLQYAAPPANVVRDAYGGNRLAGALSAAAGRQDEGRPAVRRPPERRGDGGPPRFARNASWCFR